tara:strand:- start:434 stop:601 length:168 start_codon:yes stop_codon:yes gene_type:complete
MNYISRKDLNMLIKEILALNGVVQSLNKQVGDSNEMILILEKRIELLEKQKEKKE